MMNDYLKTMESLWQGDPETLRHRVGAKQFTQQRLEWYQDRIFKYFLRDGKLTRAMLRVLEYGCGVGRLTTFFAIKWPNTDFHGVDISQAMLDVAATQEFDRHRTVYLKTDGNGIPDPVYYMDLIYSVITLQHICSRRTIGSILASFNRHLATDGRFTIQVKKWEPHLRSWDYEPPINGVPEVLPNFQKLPQQFHVEEGNAYTPDQLRLVCEAAALEVDDIVETEPIDDHGRWLWAYGRRA